MSIISAVYVPEGIAIAGDSRLTGYKNYDNGLTDCFAISDNAQKVFLLDKSPIGMASCGNAIIDGKTVADFLRIFEIEELTEDDMVESATEKLCQYLIEKGLHDGIEFLTAGFINDIPYVYWIRNGIMIRENVNDNDNSIVYGIKWGGQPEAISKLLLGDTPTIINFDLMPLKDAIDLSYFLIELTIKYERFQDSIATCGGPIDVLVITKDYARFIKHKIFNP